MDFIFLQHPLQTPVLNDDYCSADDNDLQMQHIISRPCVFDKPFLW